MRLKVQKDKKKRNDTRKNAIISESLSFKFGNSIMPKMANLKYKIKDELHVYFAEYARLDNNFFVPLKVQELSIWMRKEGLY